MNKFYIEGIIAYLTGWVLFIVLVLTTKPESWLIVKNALFGFGDYLIVGFYFTSVTLVMVSSFLRGKIEEQRK